MTLGLHLNYFFLCMHEHMTWYHNYKGA